jgi:ATP-dependent DNA ligase
MSWKFIQVEPMSAHGKFRDELLDDPNYIAEVKYDGFRLIGQFCGDLVRFTTRRISEVTGLFQERTNQVPHLSMGAEWWEGSRQMEPVPARVKRARSLDGTVIDCEVIPSRKAIAAIRAEGGAVSKAVGSIITSDPKLAVMKQLERGPLRLVVFDCLWHKGRDIRDATLIHRRGAAGEVLNAWGNPFVSMSKGEVAKKRVFHERVVAEGEEGIVLKPLDSPYDGKASRWVKLKEVWTADVVVTGTVPAREMSVKKGDDQETMTKYAKLGWIGGLAIGQYRNGKLVPVSNPKRGVSGFSDALRKEMSLHPERFIGTVIEVEHNGREPTGRFRHPRWNRPRPDKSPKDCIWRRDET